MNKKIVLIVMFLLLMSNVAFGTVVDSAKELEVEKMLAERQQTDRAERIPIKNRADVAFESPAQLTEIVQNLETATTQTLQFDLSEHQIMNVEQVLYNTDTIPYKNRAWIGAVKVETPNDLQLLIDHRSNRYFLYTELLQEPEYHAAGFFIHEGEARNKVWLRSHYFQGQMKQVLSIGKIDESPIYDADYLSITSQAFMYNAEIDGGVLLIFENPFKK